jgi:hypothetical protein
LMIIPSSLSLEMTLSKDLNLTKGETSPSLSKCLLLDKNVMFLSRTTRVWDQRSTRWLVT